MQLGSHPVAVVQYTYTHKQCRERHKTNNTYNNTKIRKSAGPAPSLRVLPWNWGKSTGKTSVRVAIHKHTIREWEAYKTHKCNLWAKRSAFKCCSGRYTQWLWRSNNYELIQNHKEVQHASRCATRRTVGVTHMSTLQLSEP